MQQRKIRVHHLMTENKDMATDVAEFLELLAFNKHSLIEVCIVDYFQSFVSNADGGLPSKVDVMQFKEIHLEIEYKWPVIRTSSQ
jgi:hypothetical protein